MMPDRFDELARRKKLEQLKPVMGEQTVLDEPAPEAMDVPSEAPVEAPTEEAVPQEKEWYQNRQVADALVGATPTLINLLTGASANHTVRGFDQANAYLKNRATQDLPTKDNTFVEDVDGKPVIGMRVDSVGKTPYYQPKAKTAADARAKNSFDSYNVYIPGQNGKPGKTFAVMQNRDTGKYTTLDGQDVVLPNNAVKNPATEKLIKEKTAGGGDKTSRFNQYNEAPLSGLSFTPGRGDLTDQTKEGYDAALKGAQQARKETFPAQKSLEELKAISTDVNALKDPAVFATNFGSLMRTAVGEKRLSDPEQELYTGGKYKSFLTQAQNYADGKFKGVIPSDIINNYLALKHDAELKLQSNIKAARDIYANPNAQTNPRMKKDVERASGQDPEQKAKESKSNEKLYADIVKKSLTVFKDQKARQKYLETKRQELGL